MPTKRFKINGRVQGVFFRKFTQAKAQDLGLRGAVRNLSDGSVEAWAEGDLDSLKAFEEWLWQGSPQSQVSEVDVYTSESQDWTDFKIIASA